MKLSGCTLLRYTDRSLSSPSPLLSLASLSPNYVGIFCNKLQEVASEGTVRDFAGRTGEHVGKVTEKGCRGSHRGRYLNGAKFVADPLGFGQPVAIKPL